MEFHHIKKHTISYYHKIKEYTHANMLRKYFLVGAFGGMLLGWWSQSGTTSTTSTTSSYTVALWNIQNTIDAYGTVELVDEQKIRFNQQWEVTKVYFKKGSEVKKWDVIAELDQDSVQSSILQSEINLQNAELQLDETLNGDNSAQILQAENNLEQTKLKLDIAQQEYDNLVEDESSKNTVSDEETTIANARLDVQNYILEWRKTLDEVNEILTDNQEYIWMENLSMTRGEANRSVPPAYSKLTALEKFFATGLTSTDNKDNLLIWLSLTKDAYQAIYTATINIYTALQHSAYGQFFTPDMVDNFKDQVYADITKIKTALVNIANTTNTVSKLWTTEDDTITLESKANEITNLKNTIVIQEKTLETTKNGTTEQQLEISKNNIRQKELALEQTKKELENLQIIAPFDGVLRKIDFKVGDKVTSSDEKYVYLENPNLVEVSILLDQIDVVNVQQGMEAEVTLDAYPGITFEWVLWDIDSTPTTTNGVVSYTVKVSIDKWEKTIYWWMTASVKIIIENKENVIVIPTTYIQSQWDIKYVLDKNDNQINIEVGSTDGMTTEITSGLTEGTVITKTIKATTSAAGSAGSSFSMPGMWGGMWGGMWWGTPPF